MCTHENFNLPYGLAIQLLFRTKDLRISKKILKKDMKHVEMLVKDEINKSYKGSLKLIKILCKR